MPLAPPQPLGDRFMAAARLAYLETAMPDDGYLFCPICQSSAWRRIRASNFSVVLMILKPVPSFYIA